MRPVKLDFQPVTIEDRDVLQSFFSCAPFRNCDFSFANIFCWKHLYNTTFAIEDGVLYIRFCVSDGIPGYLFPLGGDLGRAIDRIGADADVRGVPLRLYAVTCEMFDLIRAIYPSRFVYQSNRAWFEYIYLSEDLISLVGKRFQPKRNYINRFTRNYEWEYLPVTREIIPDCLKLYGRWYLENGGGASNVSLLEERRATETAFENFERLGLTGGALRVDGEVLAYSYGQPLGGDTFGVHAEKSLSGVEGGFAMINQQFAERNCGSYRYINREEDLGLASLRKSKLSYMPSILLEKGMVTRAC
ncbi:MAG: phosphatidylglycerol lysyltransferase domain-containing protein [Dysgonamonadaceae bacterium]|jgi:hypothetical protein|nr:phosphatidylglycerol lysyltransferase domain-containing protein [Dysgonamonadaceae bacterium]